jgi:hypothetical protein
MQQKKYYYVTLTGAVLLIAFLLFVVAPERGAGWMEDDGLFLANAWNALHGYGLDGMLPQQPVYFANVLLMQFGLTELLHQRYAYYVFWTIAAWVFFSGLDTSKFSSLRIIAIIGTLCISFSSVLLGGIFFPLAAGCYFHANKSQGYYRSALLIASGLFFAVATFMHIAFAIAMCIVVIFIFWLDRKTAFVPVFILGTPLFWGIYLYELGLDRFFTTPAGHKTDLVHLASNVFSVVWFFSSAIIAFVLLSFILKCVGIKRYKWTQCVLSFLVTAIYGLQFFGAHLISVFPEIFSDFFSARYSVETLMKAHGRVVNVPGAIYYLLIFLVCRWLAESGRWRLWITFRYPLAALGTLKNFLSADIKGMHFFIAMLGLCLLPAGYAGGSASSIAICLSAFSGPVLGVTFLMWRFLNEDHLDRIFNFLLFVWCCIFIVFAARMNLPSFEPIISRPNLITLTESPLKGIKETLQYREALIQLKNAYAESNCNNKRLILLDYVPVVHLILQHEVPNKYGVVRPGVYFPEAKLMHELDSPFGWCVLDVTTGETRVMMRENDVRDKVRSRVIQESQYSISIQSPSADIQPMMLYVK